MATLTPGLTVHVLPSLTDNILSVKSLCALGWDITFRGRGPEPDDAIVFIPSTGAYHPLRRAPGGCFHLDLEPDPGHPGCFTIATGTVSPAAPHRLAFLVDSGAQVNLCRPDLIGLLPPVPHYTPISILGVHAAGCLTSAGCLLRFADASPDRAGLIVCASEPASPASPVFAVFAAAEAPGPTDALPTSAFTRIKTPEVVAARFCLHSHHALDTFHHSAGISGVAHYPKVDRSVDYSGGISSRAVGKAPPMHHTLNGISRAIRDHYTPGTVWWCDLGNRHDPDFAGNCYPRLFREDKTGYVKLYFAPDKSSRCLTRDLHDMMSWVSRNVPGGKFMILRGDFGSEMVRQGHGDDTTTRELQDFCAKHPGFRVVPVAPHSQAANLAEGAWGIIHGKAYAIACRARLGRPAWSLVQRGAEFVYNHTAAASARDPAARLCTRSWALTGRSLDASTMLGFPGQGCWAHKADAKANVFRASAKACLYLHPATDASAQVVFDLESNKLVIVRAVAMCDLAGTVSAHLARSTYYAPHGLLVPPRADAHSQALRDLFTWTGDVGAAAVIYDPLTGMPTGVCPLVPILTSDGELVMTPATPQVPRLGVPIDTAPWLVPPLADSPLPDTPPPTIASPLGMDLQAARDLATAVLRPHMALTPLRVAADAKRSGHSLPRFLACSGASTVGEYVALHSAFMSKASYNKSAREDLVDGLRRGDITITRPAEFVVAATSRPLPSSGDASSAALADRVRAALSEHAELHRISALEPRPLPGVHVASADPPGLDGDPRVFTARYARGVAYLRSSLHDDLADTRAHAPCSDDAWALPDASSWDAPPHLAMAAAAPLNAPTAPKSAGAAARLPDFDAPNGWRASIQRELDKINRFGGWEVVPAREVRRTQHAYPDLAIIGHVVGVLRLKKNSVGDPRAADVEKKFRVAISEKGSIKLPVPSYSATADAMSNLAITAISTAIRARQTSIDVSSAYWWGRRKPLSEGGRAIFMAVPKWMDGFVDCVSGKVYRTHDQRGRRNFLRLIGNGPGCCDAGKVWQEVFDEFLLGYGLIQLITDRRVWVIRTPVGDLIVHDHVDDSRLTFTTDDVKSHFIAAWALRFGEPPQLDELDEDFVGYRHHVLPNGTIEVSCDGVIKNLKQLLVDYPLPVGMTCDSPLPEDAMRRLRDSGTGSDVLIPEALPFAQKVGGTVGFITQAVRCDSYFGYSALARYINERKLTRSVLRLLLRVAHYLVSTMHLHLYLAAPGLTHDAAGLSHLDFFDIYCDTAHASADDAEGRGGLGHGGFLLMTKSRPGQPPTGAFAWKCHLPHEGFDSPGAQELKVGSTALKYCVAVRTLQIELDCGVSPAAPTPLFTDSKSMIDGTGCARLVRSSRWLAAKYAMLRWGLACGTITLEHVDGEFNVADILTKPLVGRRFVELRARVLGLPETFPVTSTQLEDPDA